MNDTEDEEFPEYIPSPKSKHSLEVTIEALRGALKTALMYSEYERAKQIRREIKKREKKND